MLRVFIADVGGLDVGTVLLPPDRAEKMNRLSRIEDKRLSAGAYLLLCRACAALDVKCEYAVGKNGKPDFSGGELHFSLAHSGKYALCAVADMLIGADIERPRTDASRLAERFFAPDEAELVSTADDFCRIWTLKESYIKARGLSLSALPDFSVLRTSGFSYSHCVFDGYHISLCAEGDIPEAVVPEVLCLC